MDQVIHEESQFEAVPHALIEEICLRLAHNKSVRQPLPGGGMLNIDRLLPFLCVYRRNPHREDVGTGLFVKSEASYLLAPGNAPVRKGLQTLVRRIAETAAKRLESFLVLEVWAADDHAVPAAKDPITGEILLPAPRFRILTRQMHRPAGTAATLQLALQQFKLHRQRPHVYIEFTPRNHPPGMTPLISRAQGNRIGCHVIGLEVLPIYRESDHGDIYARIHRSLVRNVSRAMKKAFFAFAMDRTSVRPQHYFSLGRKSLPQQVFAVDRQLAEISQQFKFLLLVTPVNAERAWQEFIASAYTAPPVFHYRPLGADPLLLKRRLMRVATEQVDDPTLGHVMRQTQDELDRQLTMLSDIGTRKFLPGSLQVFGTVDDKLREIASRILIQVPSKPFGNAIVPTPLSAKAFAKRAEREIDYYRQQHPAFTATAIVRDDMYSGLLSTGGNLLIGREMKIPARRVEALLQHEVGTHLVTYYNGKSQPLRLLQVGLAGYDGLQEGLAVLAEYLVGGLTSQRMRTLAARVIAVDSLVRGAPFVDTFSLLVDQYKLEPRSAFTITLRVYRGGGLTKDAIYLQGFVEAIRYLNRGGDIEPLLVGKLAVDHIPVVEELLLRGALRPAVVQPRFLLDPEAQQRLDALRNGHTVAQIVDNLVPSSEE